MARVRAALARIVGMLTKHRGDEELREELESHLGDLGAFAELAVERERVVEGRDVECDGDLG